MAIKRECWICGEKVDPKQENSIYGPYGWKYYCKEPHCQAQYQAQCIEDFGDPPDPREDR